MKQSCEIVQDLLPLYADKVCSASSRELVETHLGECGDCQKKLAALRDTEFEERLHLEQKEIICHQASRFRRTAFTVGCCIAGVLMIPVVVCLIVNLATGHSLDWFFIVLTALLVTASLIVVPLMVNRKRGLATLGSFTVSLLLLLLTCCLYSGGHWFWIAAFSVLFGLSVFFTPFVLGQFDSCPVIHGRKGLFTMATDTALLFILLIAIGFYVKNNAYWHPAMLNALVFSGFAWLLFLTIRYLKVNGLVRAGLSVIECTAMAAFVNDIENWILSDNVPGLRNADFSFWGWETFNANISLIVLLSGICIGAILIVCGIIRKKQNP